MPSRRSTVATKARVKRTVALFQRGEFAGRVQHFVERAALAQHAIDDVGGNTPDGKTRHLDDPAPRGDGGARRSIGLRWGYAHASSAKNSSLQAGYGYAK